MKIVLVTGGFDPLHSGHMDYFNSARSLGNKLAVGLNSDAWLTRKKGRPFMSWQERAGIISNLRSVDYVIEFDDSDNTSINAIKECRRMWPDAEIVFANGGDRDHNNVPEMAIKDDQVSFMFAVGGTDKANSSSWILDQWRAPRTDRSWGYYRVVHQVGANTKLKELTVNPKTCLSMQQHQKRAEFWFVAEGEAAVYTLNNSSDHDLVGTYTQHQHIFIAQSQWHMLCNETDQPLKLIEIQYGENCVEDDIQRR
jgi:D-beta-D-heptose 7-phosphate kinase/D-beta-D-heptose 1-phosphate adenosyltransferase